MLQNSGNSSSGIKIDAKITEIEKEYRFYQKNGEKHPLYRNTWKIYWERRYAEIKREGKFDPDKYDYKDDWIAYWMNYIKDFYEHKIDFYKKKSAQLCMSPISISSSEGAVKRTAHKKKSSSYSDSSSDDSHYLSSSKKARKKYSESLSSINSDSFLEDVSFKSNNETVTLRSVCRTLIVLDTELGSLLSNKILDLIAKSIDLEKLQAYSSDEFLIDNDSVTFLETVKEKLKGLISTDLLEPKKIPVAKKCIQNIAQLIHQNRSKLEEKKPNLQIVKDSELDEIIVKALVSFGKNDALPEELEVIKEIFLEEVEKNVEMARKANDECHSTTNFSKSGTTCYNELSDDELNILIKNFQKLDEEEQNQIISFITEIEEKDPERVRRLQNYIVNGQNEAVPTILINDDDDDDYNFDELVAVIK